jgi:hypothetical protein
MFNAPVQDHQMNDRIAGWHEVDAKYLKIVCQFLPEALGAKVEWHRRYGHHFGTKHNPTRGL